MKLTVLGYQSPIPGPGGATPGYLIETGRGALLLDCGSGVISQLMKVFDPELLDGVILSHLHFDHITDIHILKYVMMMAATQGKRKKPLPIYAPNYPTDIFKQLFYRYFSLHPIDQNSTLRLIGLDISFLQTDHPIPCLAVKLTDHRKTILYGADTGPGTPWFPFANHPDLFIVESTYLNKNKPPVLKGHLTAEEAAKTGSRMGTKKLLLTHLFHQYTYDEVMKEASPYFDGEIYIAEIGLTINL
ncbi:MBL fold metallo-hydrolase [Microaerobacter geothermalis]|uniref:MBL fold metallo-hydrolase n=1 Tax=Microaerobacter geothermalis TaxID=674972 RepID=UPI001F427A86|nr:MBL fold metallo-hydrolase [Microaerobacter geothermalis]MCF6093140.1 MBL fold metallo-hydrolase [Microaerobacter geothermalis]